MKSLVSIFLALIILLTPFNTKLDFVNTGTYYFYTTENFQNVMVTNIKSGQGYIISCDSDKIKEVYPLLDKKQIAGISGCFDNFDMDSFTKKYQLQIKFYEQIGDITFIYGYTKQLEKYVVVDNERINIQIAKNQYCTKIGYPLILDSA